MRLNSKRGTCKKGLVKKLEARPPNLKYDILVKCWTLTNDKAYIRHCCADHPEHVKSMINCSAFKTIMQDLRSQLEELWKHKTAVLVVCVDGYGCHRARTLAAILQAYYEQRGFNSKGPFFLPAQVGRWSCAICRGASQKGKKRSRCTRH